MTFQEALQILNDRKQIQEDAPDARTGADIVLNAAHFVVIEVSAHCQTDTGGIGDWIEGGSYTGTETPESIAAEWDSNQT